MKKSYLNYVLILLCLCISSCEKENLDVTGKVKSSSNVSLTRSGDDFDPLGELASNHVALCIKNMGEGDAYLSAGTDNYSVLLEPQDNNSIRQRWKFVQIGIAPMSYNRGISVIFSDGEYRPALLGLLSGFPYGFVNIKNTSYYYYVGVMYESGDTGLNPVDRTGYMQRESPRSNNLVYRKSNAVDYARWEIIPYGNYTIEDIEYMLYDGGGLDSSSVYVDRFEVDNRNSSVPVKRSKTITTTVEETSTFSSTEGVSTSSSVSSSTSVGLPDVEGISINMGTSISTSSAKTSSFAQNETKRTTRTITETYEVEVPAYTYYKLDVIMKSYSMNLRYVATLRGEDGTTFRVKGTWKGVQATGTYLKPISQVAGEIKYVKRHIE